MEFFENLRESKLGAWLAPKLHFRLTENSDDGCSDVPRPKIVGKLSDVQPKLKCFEWQIDNFTSLPQEESYWVVSPHFNFQDYSWRIRMGLGSGSIDLFPDRKGPQRSKPLNLHWSVSVKRSDGTEHGYTTSCDWTCEDQSTRWVKQECELHLSRTELIKEKNYLIPSNRLTLLLTFEAIDIPELPFGIPRVKSELAKIVNGSSGGKTSIRVQGEEFRVHNSVISAVSPVLKSMFHHPILDRDDVVTIEDFEPQIFKEFLYYVYMGRVRDMNSDIAFGLYQIAVEYQLDELKAESLACMRSTLSIETFCDVITVALGYGERELLELATEFFSRNKDILKTEKWQAFLSENPEVANELMLKAFQTNENEE